MKNRSASAWQVVWSDQTHCLNVHLPLGRTTAGLGVSNARPGVPALGLWLLYYVKHTQIKVILIVWERILKIAQSFVQHF